MMHHPVYSTAKGRCNPWILLSFHGAMREADIVFSGHDHNYARRTEYYKARFWKKEEPTTFIATNASDKVYPIKKKENLDTSFTGKPVYEYVQIMPNALVVRTLQLDSGELVDEVTLCK
jgi:hypothetical protein